MSKTETVFIGDVRARAVLEWTFSPRRDVARISLECHPPRGLLFVASLRCNGLEQVVLPKPLPVQTFEAEGDSPSLMAGFLPPIRAEQNALRIAFVSRDYQIVRVRMRVWYVGQT